MSVVILGVVLGDLLFYLLAILGLTAIAHWLVELFVVVKYLGGVYLIWLGVRLWRRHQRNGGPRSPPDYW